MHTHLKGRIFSSEGVSYLVLQEESKSPEWLNVKSLGREPTVHRMLVEDVAKRLTEVDARRT